MQVVDNTVRPGLTILKVSWEMVVLAWTQRLSRLSHGGGDSATGGDYVSVMAADQHQYLGSGSNYYLRDEQPRQFQGHEVKDVGADEVDGHGVGGTSGSDVDDLDTTFEGDDPVNTVQGPCSLADDAVIPEHRHTNLVGDLKVTEAQLRSLNGSSNAAPERRQTRLAGGLLATEERRRPCAAAAGDNENIVGVTPRSSCLSSGVNRSDVDIGVKPHSSCLSSNVNCSDSVDYSRIQRVMDMVRHHREDDDDVTLPSWRQLVQCSNGRCTSNSPSDGPDYPAETRDNRSSGKVCAQGLPVKHTRFRCDTGKYANDQTDDTHGAGEYNRGEVVNTQERGEYRESRVQVNNGKFANTSEFLPISYSCSDADVHERYQSSASIQLAPRHETDISDGLNTHNTHEVREYRNGEYEEVSDRQNFVESSSTAILHLAPNRMGPRSYVSRNNDEEDGSRSVVDMESTHILQYDRVQAVKKQDRYH